MDDDVTHDLLTGASAALNAAAGDLRLLGSATDDGALATDARLLADAVELELQTVCAIRMRWQRRGG